MTYRTLLIFVLVYLVLTCIVGIIKVHNDKSEEIERLQIENLKLENEILRHKLNPPKP